MENYLQFMKNCIRPPYEKLKPLKSGFIENSNFENNRDPCTNVWQNHSPLCTERAWAHQWKLGQLLWDKEDDRKKTCQQREKANII